MENQPKGNEIPAGKSFLRKFFKSHAFLVVMGSFLCGLFLLERAFPQIEETVEDYFQEAITQASATYVTVRLVDGAISVVSESSLSAEFFVGFNLAAGHVLEPLDDVVERLSDILFTTIVSLGIQKVVYEIVCEYFFVLAVVFIAGTFFISFFCKNATAFRLYKFGKKALLLLVFIRLLFPFTALISSGIEAHFFAPRIEECHNSMKWVASNEELSKIFSSENTFWGKAQKMPEYISTQFKSIWENANNLTENSLKLSWLYIALFLIQTIFLPLFSFFILVKITNLLFEKNLPAILLDPTQRHRKIDGKSEDAL